MASLCIDKHNFIDLVDTFKIESLCYKFLPSIEDLRRNDKIKFSDSSNILNPSHQN